MITIVATEGHILTDGLIYGKQIYYYEGGRLPEEFWEITEEEYEEILRLGEEVE